MANGSTRRSRSSAAGIRTSSPVGTSRRSEDAEDQDDGDYLPQSTQAATSTLADIGSRLTAFWPVPSTSSSQRPAGETGKRQERGRAEEGDEDVDNSDEEDDSESDGQRMDGEDAAGQYRDAMGQDGTADTASTPSKLYPDLPSFKPTILVQSPNGVVAGEAPVASTSRHPAAPEPTWAPSQIPPSTSATLTAATQAPPSGSGLTAEQRQRVEENRARALAAKARREEQKRIDLEIASIKVKEERAEKARAFGQASLESYGVTFGSNRKPKQDFRVPMKKDASSLKKQEDRRKEYLELREKVTEQQRRAMELPPEPFTPDPRCSPEQLKILDEVRASKNVFFTGSAGTGKSFMLSELVRMLQHDRRQTAVCAPTGIAAVNVDGKTFHSWAKVGLGHGSVHDLYNRVINGQKKQQREAQRDGRTPPAELAIMTTSVLIIDEISMLEPNLFERVSLVCKAIRHDPRPFGGMQLIVSGDFFQLPPVLKDDDITCPYCGSPGFWRDKKAGTVTCIPPLHKKFEGTPCGKVRAEYKYCFETATWQELEMTTVELNRVFRQSDLAFITALNKVRRGQVDGETDALFKSRMHPLPPSAIFPTNLYPKKKEVNTENTKQFDLLEDEPSCFEANDAIVGPYAQTFASKLDKDVQAAKTLNLKIGAQVLLLVNMDQNAGLVNGSRGVVIDWHDVEDKDSHRDVTHGRVRGPARDEAWRASAEQTWQAEQQHAALPVVLFANGATVIIHPYTWTIEIDRDNSVSRTQLPLTLAWAITCHKSQGQSLDRLIVHLMSVWENGQAYVALSRARTLEGLQVLGWSPNVVRADPLVSGFYNSVAEGKPFGERDDSVVRIQHYFPEGLVGALAPNPNWRPPARLLHGSLSKQMSFVSRYQAAGSTPLALPDAPPAPGPSQPPNLSLYGLSFSSLGAGSSGGSSYHTSQSMGSVVSHGLPTPLTEMPRDVAGALGVYQQRLASLLTDLAGVIKDQHFDLASIHKHTAEAIDQILGSGPGPSNVDVKMEEVAVKMEELSQTAAKKGRKREHKRRRKHKDSQGQHGQV